MLRMPMISQRHMKKLKKQLLGYKKQLLKLQKLKETNIVKLLIIGLKKSRNKSKISKLKKEKSTLIQNNYIYSSADNKEKEKELNDHLETMTQIAQKID